MLFNYYMYVTANMPRQLASNAHKFFELAISRNEYLVSVDLIIQ